MSREEGRHVTPVDAESIDWLEVAAHCKSPADFVEQIGRDSKKSAENIESSVDAAC